jgi:hypothetical protein
MWDAALRVGGRQVFAEVFGGRVELRQAAYVYLLGWVTPPSLGGELTDLGMRAVKDGWWVDPPPEVQQQVRLRQEEAFNDLQAWVDRQQRNLIENEQAVDAALMPPPPPRPPPAPSVSFASPLRLPICPLDCLSVSLTVCLHAEERQHTPAIVAAAGLRDEVAAALHGAGLRRQTTRVPERAERD